MSMTNASTAVVSPDTTAPSPSPVNRESSEDITDAHAQENLESMERFKPLAGTEPVAIPSRTEYNTQDITVIIEDSTSGNAFGEPPSYDADIASIVPIYSPMSTSVCSRLALAEPGFIIQDETAVDLGEAGICEGDKAFTPLICQPGEDEARKIPPTYGTQGVEPTASIQSVTTDGTQAQSSNKQVPAKPAKGFWIADWIALWAPVILALGVIAFGYFDFVIVICVNLVSNVGQKVGYLVAVHILNVMVLWAYYKAITTEPGRVPEKYSIPPEHVTRNEKTGRLTHVADGLSCPHPTFTTLSTGGARLCYNCAVFKPDRTHHCSTCKRCILRYDHHCPWVANCVGHGNHRYFYQFLVYTALMCVFYMATSAVYMIDFITGKGTGQLYSLALAVFVVAAIFFLSVAGLASMHTRLLLTNKTTMEMHYLPKFTVATKRPNGFDLGCGQNWRTMMGPNLAYWLLPISGEWESKGEGTEFPVCMLTAMNGQVQAASA